MNEIFVDPDGWTWEGRMDGTVKMTISPKGESLSGFEEPMSFFRANRDFGPLRRVGEE